MLGQACMCPPGAITTFNLSRSAIMHPSSSGWYNMRAVQAGRVGRKVQLRPISGDLEHHAGARLGQQSADYRPQVAHYLTSSPRPPSTARNMDRAFSLLHPYPNSPLSASPAHLAACQLDGSDLTTEPRGVGSGGGLS